MKAEERFRQMIARIRRSSRLIDAAFRRQEELGGRERMIAACQTVSQVKREAERAGQTTEAVAALEERLWTRLRDGAAPQDLDLQREVRAARVDVAGSEAQRMLEETMEHLEEMYGVDLDALPDFGEIDIAPADIDPPKPVRRKRRTRT